MGVPACLSGGGLLLGIENVRRKGVVGISDLKKVKGMRSYLLVGKHGKTQLSGGVPSRLILLFGRGGRKKGPFHKVDTRGKPLYWKGPSLKIRKGWSSLQWEGGMWGKPPF